ncbi:MULTISPECIES: outer membrane protein assembly factor BamB family protein [unclassified Saccharothrix]|uniref:outer membrane protein assembly factor BamB family protein n=1 Tax=unclassified Saccharothrix TaxID=2593673 RepID=UPI00307D6A0B
MATKNRTGPAALAIAAAALLTSAVPSAGANPTPASPATAPSLAPTWSSHFGAGKYYASPVVAGEHVYVGDENGHLTKFPLATGTAGPGFTPTWSTNECFNGIYGKAAVGHGKVFVSTIAGFVCAFDDVTPPVPGPDGVPRPRLVWRTQMPSKGWANGPVLVGDTVYATGHNGDVLALDQATGTATWTANVGGSDAQHPLLASPTVLGGTVYVGTFDGRIMSVIPPTAGATGTATRIQGFEGRIADVLATDGTHLYAAVNHPSSPHSGTVRAVSVTTGGAIRWNYDTGRPSTYSGRVQAPAVVDGIVYVPTKTHIVYVDSESGLWAKATADAGLNQPTTPAVVNGVAYTGGIAAGGAASGAFQAFDAKTGALLYYSRTDTVANTSPAVAPDGKVLLGGGNSGQGGGVVWAYAPANYQVNR